MLKIIKRNFGIIIKPNMTISLITEHGYIKKESTISILIYTFLSWLVILISLLIDQFILKKDMSLFFYILLIILFPLFFFIYYIHIWVDSFFIKFISSKFNSNKNFNNYFSVYSYLWPPLFFLLLFNSTISKSNFFNLSYDNFEMFFMIICYIWYFILSIISLKKLNNFNIVKAGLISLVLFIQLIIIKFLGILLDYIK